MPGTFTIDTVVSLLDKYPFSPAGATVISLLLWNKARQLSAYELTFGQWLKDTASARTKAYLAWVFLKTLNRVVVRLIINRGWKRDRPAWTSGKEVIVITGGAGGIGGALVDLLSKKTNKVAVLDLGPPTYKARNVNYYKCDVSSEKQVAEVAKQIRSDLGHPTILINNAGIARGETIMNLSAQQFMKTYKVNTLAAFIIIKEFIPHIIKTNHGHIMTVASSASYASIPQLSEYACSKSAVLSLHEVLSSELIHRYNAPRVRTSVICPTKVQTNMGQAMEDHPSQFWTPVLTPQEVAKEMFALIDSGLSGHKVMPLYASLILPSIRALPEWHRFVVNTAGKTHETITDKRNASIMEDYRKKLAEQDENKDD
ncbi:uncharacterized protein L969DRAFT_88563 [Mixia osmundae IAM 14324]|uniref:Short-chain dehydrogenase/reductase 3 n=1 Tax=Mixia osmundae (strain CBS 9802 / IAM 14324 / JCM 22182 / KY 12970) TaxID=764103 RepID=G7E6Q0_MIXOS|nr:uncharacterized protein L969DRAFT_88563 [Mixia osmundae IAM 14324]KEI39110.1 hypothetical protein L969DRAFT_88563 [Mixia osmundae IAM 14324]GAA98510.1 hypothetical protein E5Q_05196 [Mixia osmundae IAM 14324]